MIGRIVAALKRAPLLWSALKPLRWLWWRLWWRVLVPIHRSALAAGLLFTHSIETARRLNPDPLAAAVLANRTAGRWLNRKLCRLSFRLRLPVSLGRPYDAILEMSSRCVLRCPLCTTGGLKHAAAHVRRGEMRAENFRAALDRLLPWVEQVLLYNWGEPFLNPALCECIAYAARNRVVTRVSTNMQLYTEDLGRGLVESGLTALVVSCDGLTQESYEQYRAGGSLEKVRRGVEHLIALKRARGAVYPLVIMQFIVFRHNEHEREAFERHWRAQGVDGVDFIRMSYMSLEGRSRAEELALVPQDPAWAPHFPYGKVRACEDLYRHVTVNWDGGLFTCCFPSGENAYELGNILHEPFGRIWNGPKYRYSRRLVARQRCDPAWHETMCHDCTGIFPDEAARRYWTKGGAS